MNLEPADFAHLFLDNVPMMDMRAPVEFDQGAFPSAVSLPLMTDDERAQVGTCYKLKGQQAAIQLGHKLVSGKIKDERMARWLEFARQHPHGYLYCFRGGLRSQTVQQWLQQAGCDYPLITGGYKALRRFLIEELERQSTQRQFVIISGRTGSAKTTLINQLPNSIDLEGYANHRGSSFGRHSTPQPSQINFEHQMTIELMKRSDAVIPVEDESQVIGSLHISDCLFYQLKEAPIVVIEKSLEERVENVLTDYVIELSQEYCVMLGDTDGFQAYAQYMIGGMNRIRKRLGGLMHQQLLATMEDAMREQMRTGNIDRHRDWISSLLEHYYDKMYDYQLSLKTERVIGTSNGQPAEVMALIENHWK